MTRPDCYQCVYRRSVAGDTHSACGHPAFAETLRDPIGQLVSALHATFRDGPRTAPGITIRGREYGIRNGWFMHPFNFDPVWLEACSGFTQTKTGESYGTCDN